MVNGNINIAGISIQNIPNANKKLDLAGSDSRSVNSNNDYIAFADYSGTASDSSKQGSGTAPYVITSPKSSLALYENETDALPKYLYGDGASWTETTDVKAQEIFNNSQNENGKHYSYKNTGVTDFNFKSAISTYNDNQTTEAITNFPVLQITAGKATTVNNYLDILTNGGFTKANNLNSSDVVHVGASTEVYKYENGKFVKSSDTPALQVVKDNKKNISFSTTTDYDNGKDRFTLLTVTFTEQGHSYNVLVPVLVRRVLEIDFSATLTYGTNFDSSHYALLENHVLENFGSSITGYLTYTYNSKDGEYTDYGWQNYINAGGNVTGSINKTIVFSQDSGIIPTGTQLTLISRADNRAYYYTVTDEEKNEISLSKFKNSNDESYQSPSVAELMQAVADDKGSSFIEVDANGKPTDAPQEEGKNYPLPTVKIDSKYYRLATSGENGTCDIKVDESNLKNGTKSVISESYYLVITVPKNATEALNGSIQTKIARDIPNQVHYRTIKNGEETLDNHSNTASTYLIFSGYQQNLNEENITDIYKKISTVDSTLKIDAVDEITFPNDQVYNENDQLYQRFVGGLQKTVSDKTSSEQFPSGTTGTANFYVYQKKGDKKIYYKYEKGSWSSVGETEAVAVSYQWTSTGGNMELPLTTDGTNNGAISLQEVRKFVKDNKSSENSTFYVEVRMDATIPAVGLSVIPESEVEGDVPKDFTKLVYSSQLSTEKQSLTYSNIRAQEMNTKTSYYREATTGAKLTYEANEIDQLGINLLDLRYLDVEKEHSLIDTTATYDLSALKNLEDTLKNSNGIKFTLSLMPKNIVSGSNQEEYQGALTDAENYLDVQLKSNDSGKISYQNGSWSWTVPKETYWSNDKLKTDSVFNGNFLTQSILLKVKITNIESLNHYYSNYQVSLTAEVLGKDEVAIADTNRSDNIIYTLTRINLGFVENKKESTATN